MKLGIEIAQQQILSQKMILSAQILQMSSLELEAYIKEMSLENPVIDLEETRDNAAAEETDFERKLEWLNKMDEQNRVYYSKSSDQSDFESTYENLSGGGEDLYEHVGSQIITLHISKKEKAILAYMIRCLDSKGYFDEELSAVAERYNITEDEAEEYLRIIQGLEPAGIGARNLKECLLIQVARHVDGEYENEEIIKEIIEDYLEYIGRNNLTYISKKLKISIEKTVEACNHIKKLNPKPGSGFASGENLKYIKPDVTVVKHSSGYEIILNDYLYPKMSINNYYRGLSKFNDSKEVSSYINKKVRQAEWIMTCIDQRNKTLVDVVRTIIDKQITFFDKGGLNLRALKLKDVADECGIHESTVSRAVKEKYLQCSWGIYPISYFFTKGVNTGGDEDMATIQIKEMIAEIIKGENRKKPYSDRIIGDMLAEKGVNISRRTVAKYRESMGIRETSGRRGYD